VPQLPPPPPQMEAWGAVLRPGKTLKVKPVEPESTIVITQARASPGAGLG